MKPEDAATHNGFVTLVKPYERSRVWGWGPTINASRRAANLTYDQEQKQGSLTTRWFGESNPTPDARFRVERDDLGFYAAFQEVRA